MSSRCNIFKLACVILNKICLKGDFAIGPSHSPFQFWQRKQTFGCLLERRAKTAPDVAACRHPATSTQILKNMVHEIANRTIGGARVYAYTPGRVKNEPTNPTYFGYIPPEPASWTKLRKGGGQPLPSAICPIDSGHRKWSSGVAASAARRDSSQDRSPWQRSDQLTSAHGSPRTRQATTEERRWPRPSDLAA